MVKMMLNKGYTLDYVMGLDVYEWMIHLGCIFFDNDQDGEEEEDHV